MPGRLRMEGLVVEHMRFNVGVVEWKTTSKWRTRRAKCPDASSRATAHRDSRWIDLARLRNSTCNFGESSRPRRWDVGRTAVQTHHQQHFKCREEMARRQVRQKPKYGRGINVWCLRACARALARRKPVPRGNAEIGLGWEEGAYQAGAPSEADNAARNTRLRRVSTRSDRRRRNHPAERWRKGRACPSPRGSEDCLGGGGATKSQTHRNEALRARNALLGRQTDDRPPTHLPRIHKRHMLVRT